MSNEIDLILASRMTPALADIPKLEREAAAMDQLAESCRLRISADRAAGNTSQLWAVQVVAVEAELARDQRRAFARAARRAHRVGLG